MIRPVRPGDKAFVRYVRNQPSVRLASFNTHRVSEAEHAAWFGRTLKNGTYFFIIEDEKSRRRAGSVRISRSMGRRGEIHIALLPGFRRKGLARRAVLRALEASGRSGWKPRSVSAFIKKNNTRSIRLFRACGFKPVQGRAGIVRLEWRRSEQIKTPVIHVVDCGPEIGLGHIMRQSALSEVLIKEGFDSLFLARVHGHVNKRALARTLPAGARVYFSDRDLRRGLGGRASAALLVDTLDTPPASEFKDFLRMGVPIFFIGNYRRVPSWADCCINPYLKPVALSSRTKVLTDPAYTILSRRFIKGVRSIAAGKRNSIFVLPGGGNTRGMVFKILRALKDMKGRSVNVVIGHQFTQDRRLAAAVSGSKGAIRIFKNIAPEKVAALMSSSRLGVLSFGRSLDEARFAGLPTILLSSSRLNEDAARHAAKSGSSFFLGDFRQGGVSRIRTAVEGLLADEKKLSGMRLAGRRQIDGKGAERVAGIIRCIAGNVR